MRSCWALPRCCTCRQATCSRRVSLCARQVGGQQGRCWRAVPALKARCEPAGNAGQTLTSHSTCRPPAGDWAQALALAPAVSHSNGQQLARRRVEGLRGGGAGSAEVLPLMLAAGLQQEACVLLREEGLLGKAADIAAVEAAG